MLEFKDNKGNVVGRGFMVMNTVCIFCGKQILPTDGKALALDEPYYAMLHEQCAPHYSFPKKWPHNQPQIAYNPPSPKFQ